MDHTSSTTWGGKLLRVALAFVMAFALTPTLTGLSVASGSGEYQVYADTTVLDAYSVGTTSSDSVTATLYSDYTMKITGSGAMADYSSYSAAPWYSAYYDRIKVIEVGDNITKIGAYSFSGKDQGQSGYSALTYVKGGSSLATIGAYAFNGAINTIAYDFTGHALTSVGIDAFGHGGQQRYNTACNIIYVSDSVSASNSSPCSAWPTASG